MTNKEKYAKEILDIVCSGGEKIAMVDHTLQSCMSSRCQCSVCAFNSMGSCREHFVEWCNKEYQEFDWSNVKVDTPILVKTKKDENWKRRYFAAYKDGRVYAWDSGATSWSVTNKLSWGYKYAKLIDKPEDIDALPTPFPSSKIEIK